MFLWMHSDIAIGSVIRQLFDPQWYRPLYYASRRLTTAERNYPTTEREALVLRTYNLNTLNHKLKQDRE